MRFLVFLLLLARPLAALPQDPAALEATLKRGSDAEKVSAIEASAGSSDARIAAAVAKALADPSLAVGTAAADALGRMDGDASLAALHGAASKFGADAGRLTAVFRAIGRRADPASVDLLASKPTAPLSFPVIRARIYALANIRSNTAVEALVGMTSLDNATRSETAVFSTDLRAALASLTGVDQGASAQAWLAWWRRSRNGYECPAERPQIPRIHALSWEGFWGEPYAAGAPTITPKDSGMSVADALKALSSSDATEVLAAIDTLGRSDDARALTALHRGMGVRALRDDPALFAAVLKAVARHGDPSSVTVLQDKPFAVPTFDAVRARIYGLANIRSRESVDALIAMAQLGSPAPGEAFVFIDDFRTALRILTDVDHGTSRVEWTSWWRANRDHFELPAERPWIPEILALQWEAFWGEPYGVDQPSAPGRPGMSSEDAIRALAGSDTAARRAAARVLAEASDAKSLNALHAAAGRKDFAKDPESLAAVLRAIGRRGDPSSVGVLGDKPLAVLDFEVIRARLYGLANIRSRESVARLISAMKLASPPAGQPFVFVDDLRTCLVVLTGVDHGPWKGEWDRWWRSRPRSYEVPAERPALEPLLALRWEAFWGEPYGR